MSLQVVNSLAMLGFFPLDEGDAPESYGKAMHTIATVDGVTGAKVNQPYIGNCEPRYG